MEFSFGNLRISILVQGRPNVERREYASDEKVQGPDTELFPGTDPRDYEYDYSALGTRILVSLTSSQIRTPYPQD